MNRPEEPRSDEPTSVEPLPEPGEDALATLLAEVLSSEAGRIEPADRLADIRSGAAATRRRGWLPVAAGAAAVVVIGSGAWAAVTIGSRDARPPGVAARSGPSASASPSVGPSGVQPSPSPRSTPAGPAVTLPVYYVGREVKGLFREFQVTTVQGQGVQARIQTALRLAADPTAAQRVGDVTSWLPGTSGRLTARLLKPGELSITLPATEAQAVGRTAEQARLAAQQLAWTATAAAQQADLAVLIGFEGDTVGRDRLFGSLSVAGAFHRPGVSLAYQDLSAIWVLQPDPGEIVHPTTVVSGQACTLEANVAWQLLRGGAVVRSGRTTATSGCPTRGTWSVAFKALAPGTYAFRAYEPSPKGDGTLEGLDTTTFTVR